MSPAETAILGVYFFILTILAMYGWHRYYLVYLYMKHKEDRPKPGEMTRLPRVTIQLPIYNEMYVVERLIQAVCEIDYPGELLQLQVLDDSTDETRGIAEAVVRRHAALGHDIEYIHRTDRTGFKAGALEHGLKTATGEFVAIFDADFIPPVDFLRKTLPYFFSSDKVALVQARWGHINADYSLLTKIQSILLDGHFVLEHGSRNRSGRFFNFNGTAGIWRREVIADAGGWQHDTLTEDLDLSYRAQLRGWKFVFLQDLIAPAEVPVEMNSFKSQQFRWAKGSIQTCRKVLPAILKSDLPFAIKAEAFFHLTANFNYVLMVLLSVLMFPAMVIRYNMGWYEMLLIDVPLFMAATFSVMNFYMVCQREIYPDWVSRLKYLPFLMSIGIGLSVNNTKAVFEAMFDKKTDFERTPKYGIEGASDDWMGKKYRQAFVVQPLIEIALGLYFTATVFYALANQIYGTLPFLVLFQIGFLYMGLLSVVQQFGGGGVVLKTQVASGK